jgi:hypothetical protein
MSPRTFDDKRQPGRHLLGRLATMTSIDGAAARLCTVMRSQDGLVRVNANGAKIDDEFMLHFSGDSSLSDGTYRVLWRHDPIVLAKLIKPTKPGRAGFSQAESRTRPG